MGEAFCNRLVVANEATKYIKIKICRDLRWLKNDVKNATINQKTSGLDRTRDGMRGEDNGWHRGSAIRSFWGQSSWAGWGKLK
jgi:hypothetical protein